jgi:D-alanyl-lipoteichoic acid acyltransferase DltB (MBOAT superfamily)
VTIPSLSFLLFFSLVFLLYHFPLKEKTKAQNILLLLASYVFYGVVNWRMIPLLFIATVVFYRLGILIEKSREEEIPGKSTLFTTCGVCLGVGLLLYFKYFNFFITSFSELFAALGLHTNWHTFNIIMPLGVSFFTFKLISYFIEVHERVMKPEKDIYAFAVYTAFFPTIMAGPIDRPNMFIPQLHSKRTFDYDMAVDGCRQILWGMFKKLVIADNVATFVDKSWGSINTSSGGNLAIAVFLYSIQLYTDFSGYSDMAIGTGKLLGFRIARNFNYPFFGRNIAEFWRNWHMSLTSWLTDYVFMPLYEKFIKAGKSGIIAAIIINFALVGLWHEANLTWLFFGLLQGVLFIPLIVSGSFMKIKKFKPNKYGLPDVKDFTGMLGTFILFSLCLIIVRAENIGQAGTFVRQLAGGSLPFFSGLPRITLVPMELINKIPFVVAIFIFIIEWCSYTSKFEYALCLVARANIVLRYFIYLSMFLMCIFFSGGEAHEFIYQGY